MRSFLAGERKTSRQKNLFQFFPRYRGDSRHELHGQQVLLFIDHLGGHPSVSLGAVAAFFLGQGTIHNAKANRVRDIASAQDDLDSSLETSSTVTGRPAYFSASEMRTGERDRDLDRMSAYADELQKAADKKV